MTHCFPRGSRPFYKVYSYLSHSYDTSLLFIIPKKNIWSLSLILF